MIDPRSFLPPSALPWWARTAQTPALPLHDLVAAYRDDMTRRQLSPLYVSGTIRRLERVVRTVAVRRVDEIGPLEIGRAIARVNGPREQNLHRGAVHSFFAFLADAHLYLGPNPAESVRRSREIPRRLRRAIDVREFQRLLLSSPVLRATLYFLMATSGLRPSEIASLTWGEIDLDKAEIRVRGRWTKTRRDGLLPLARLVRDRLRPLRQAWRDAGSPADARVFACGMTTPRTYYLDLERAEVERETAAGVLDLYGLRHSFATQLARHGETLALAQRLMRHTDPRLTASIYTRLVSEDGRTAVNRVARAFSGKARIGKQRKKSR